MDEQCLNGFAHVSESALEGVLQKGGADVPDGNGDVCDRKTVLSLAVMKHAKPGWTQQDANRALNSCFLRENPDAYHDLPVTPDMIADVVTPSEAKFVHDFEKSLEVVKVCICVRPVLI
jgi:hypothetical protein